MSYMLNWVLNRPALLIENVGVQNPSFVSDVFAFGQLKGFVFRRSLGKDSNKTSVGKSHRTINT